MTPARMAQIHAAAFTLQRPWSRQEFTDLLDQPSTFLKPVGESGFALGRAIADEAELLTIAVHPDDQRLGHGQACLNAFVDHAKSNAIETLFLEVEADNEAAIGLYTATGFQNSGRRKNYYKRSDGRRSDAILMVLKLNQDMSNP